VTRFDIELYAATLDVAPQFVTTGFPLGAALADASDRVSQPIVLLVSEHVDIRR
jgi:hypothetical protein